MILSCLYIILFATGVTFIYIDNFSAGIVLFSASLAVVVAAVYFGRIRPRQAAENSVHTGLTELGFLPASDKSAFRGIRRIIARSAIIPGYFPHITDIFSGTGEAPIYFGRYFMVDTFETGFFFFKQLNVPVNSMHIRSMHIRFRADQPDHLPFASAFRISGDFDPVSPDTADSVLINAIDMCRFANLQLADNSVLVDYQGFYPAQLQRCGLRDQMDGLRRVLRLIRILEQSETIWR